MFHRALLGCLTQRLDAFEWVAFKILSLSAPFAKRQAPCAVVVVSARCDTPTDEHPFQELREVDVLNGCDALHGGVAHKHLKSFGVVGTCTLLNHACQILLIMRCDFLNFHFLSF